MNRRIILIVTLVAAVLWAYGPGPVAEIARADNPPIGYGEGSTIVVNTTEDAIWPDGNCSLREAIRTSNLNEWVDACELGSGRDTILIPSGLYLLDTVCEGEDGDWCGDLDITDSVTILGHGAGSTVIDGARLDRVIEVAPHTGVEIERMTLANGRVAGQRGGAILNRGYLVLSAVTIRDSVAAGSLGAEGGGLANVADLSDATANLFDSRIEGNRAYGGGGLLNVAESPFIGTLRLVRCTVDGNSAALAGAGIWQPRGSGQYGGAASLTVDASTVSRNTVSSREATAGDGGGIAIMGGSATVVNSTISGNRASGSGLPHLSGLGGGLYVANYDSWPSVYLLNSTVADNRSTAGGPGVAAANLGESGAGLSVYLKNSIVAYNRVQSLSGQSCLIVDWGIGEVILSSLGYNLEDGRSCQLSEPTDRMETDPMLAPLGDYGGGTETHLLLSGSPAIDGGDDGACPCGDQRGVPRPQGNHSDIGSVEVEVDPQEPSPPKPKAEAPGWRLIAWERHPSISQAGVVPSTGTAPRPAIVPKPRPQLSVRPPGVTDEAVMDATKPRPATEEVTDDAIKPSA